MTQLVHVCLSGSLACSGLVPCEACLHEQQLRMLPRLAKIAGYNGSLEQWRRVLDGFVQGWMHVQESMYSDPALRARMHVRDVTQAQASAPSIPLEAPAPAPAAPTFWGGRTEQPSPFAAPPGYPPPGYAAPEAPPQGPLWRHPMAPPSAAEQPISRSADQPDQAPQVLGQVVHGQQPAPEVSSGGPPDPRTPGPPGLGFDPLATDLGPAELARIMERSRAGGGRARVTVRSRAPDPRSGSPQTVGPAVRSSVGPKDAISSGSPDPRTTGQLDLSEEDLLQAAVPVDPGSTPGSTNGAPAR